MANPFLLWRRWRDARRRTAFEDVLKHVLTRTIEGREAGVDSVAGHLGFSQKRVLHLAVEMESAGLLRSEGARLALTPAGEKWATQVVRAHRLWETYLANEAHVPIEALHKPAEAAEHRLTPEQVDALDASLGYPRNDPHGDPIPTASGQIAALDARAVTSFPLGQAAEIAHLEDEPAALFRQIPEALRPGTVVRRVSSSPAEVTLSDGAREYRLTPLVAGNIQVVPAPEAKADPSLAPLSALALGEEAEVVAIGPGLRGFTRRRLLDLGLTPQARVSVHLDNAFGDPRAYRVRGATIALRREQAAHIFVRRHGVLASA
ncbi:MAG: metal-dependent transcriptional regulator [Bryobacterales bacterium]|nr:metal-dependent transcriptional regulator [Bryobacterales bacterium]